MTCRFLANEIYCHSGGVSHGEVKVIYYLVKGTLEVLNSAYKLDMLNIEVLCNSRCLIHLGVFLYTKGNCKCLDAGVELTCGCGDYR